jgi:hypothetical protein
MAVESHGESKDEGFECSDITAPSEERAEWITDEQMRILNLGRRQPIGRMSLDEEGARNSNVSDASSVSTESFEIVNRPAQTWINASTVPGAPLG